MTKRSEAERKRFFALMERYCQIASLLPTVEDLDADDEAEMAQVKVILAELAKVKSKIDTMLIKCQTLT